MGKNKHPKPTPIPGANFKAPGNPIAERQRPEEAPGTSNIPDARSRTETRTQNQHSASGSKRSRSRDSSTSTINKPPLPKRLTEVQPESEASGAPLGTPGTYAAAARMHNKPNSMEEPRKWEDFELRIFKTNAQPQPITYQDFCNIQTLLMIKTIAFLREVGYEGAAVTRGDSMKYEAALKCGVIFCRNKKESFDWIKQNVHQLTNGEFRAWDKTEVRSVFLRFFVPTGLDSIVSKDFLELILFHHPDIAGTKWNILKEFRPRKEVKPGEWAPVGNRIVVVETPRAVIEYIRQKGTQTSEGAQSWRIDGAWGMVKVQVASPHDLLPDRQEQAKSNKVIADLSEKLQKMKDLPKPQINMGNELTPTLQTSSSSSLINTPPTNTNWAEEMEAADTKKAMDDPQDDFDLDQVPIKFLKSNGTKSKFDRLKKQNRSPIQVRLASIANKRVQNAKKSD